MPCSEKQQSHESCRIRSLCTSQLQALCVCFVCLVSPPGCSGGVVTMRAESGWWHCQHLMGSLLWSSGPLSYHLQPGVSMPMLATGPENVQIHVCYQTSITMICVITEWQSSLTDGESQRKRLVPPDSMKLCSVAALGLHYNHEACLC